MKSDKTDSRVLQTVTKSLKQIKESFREELLALKSLGIKNEGNERENPPRDMQQPERMIMSHSTLNNEALKTEFESWSQHCYSLQRMPASS